MFQRIKSIACIPAFKEEAMIAKIVLSTQKYVDLVIVCDDGSPDMTAEIAEKLGAVTIKHDRNIGKGSAVKSLLNEASKYNSDFVVLLDADGQHDPSEIPMLLKPIEQGEADLVVGSRYLGKNDEIPLRRKIGLIIIDFLLRETNVTRVNDTQCGFRAFSREAVEAISTFDAEGYGVESEILALATKNGLRVSEVPVNVRYKGLNNTSKNSFLKHGGELVWTYLRLVAKKRPLIFLGAPGIILFLTGLLSALGLILAALTTGRYDIPEILAILETTVCGLVLMIASTMPFSLSRLRMTR